MEDYYIRNLRQQDLGTWKEFVDELTKAYSQVDNKEQAKVDIGLLWDNKKLAESNFIKFTEQYRHNARLVNYENKLHYDKLRQVLPRDIRLALATQEIQAQKQGIIPEWDEYLESAMEIFKFLHPDKVLSSRQRVKATNNQQKDPNAMDIGAQTMSKDKGKGKEIDGGELAPEKEYRERELAELQALIPEDLRSDTGASVTGLYELVGIVAHKGAEADSGHYIGYVKKRALHPVKVGDEGEKGALDEDDEDWYKFDDEKVSIFPKDKLPTLEGGGKPFCLHR